jgi:hypothetical protein
MVGEGTGGDIKGGGHVIRRGERNRRFLAF